MRSLRVQLRRVTVLAVLLLGMLLAGSGVGVGQPPPPPTPPPNPSDQQLDQSKRDIAGKADEVGRLSSELTQVQAEADRLGEQLGARQEIANQALADLELARDAAAVAAARAQATRAEAAAASVAIEQTQQRVDEFLAEIYLRGADAGSLGLLEQAANPGEVVERAEASEALAAEQRAALESLQKARVAKVNADSLARAASEDAQRKQAAADGAKRSADSAVATATAQVEAGLAQLRAVEARRVEIERQLDALSARDAGLRAQRKRYLDYQEALAAAARAEQAAAAARAGRAGRSGAVGGLPEVIDRALSQLGTTYAWGGGNRNGPTRGIRDGGVADRFGDFRKTGFDCSGLMIYAFGAAGIPLPHYSGYQYNAGRKVPLAEKRPGDMLFWSTGGRIHHVAMYLGGGKMVEAPYSGGKVRVTSVRTDGLMPYVTRLI